MAGQGLARAHDSGTRPFAPASDGDTIIVWISRVTDDFEALMRVLWAAEPFSGFGPDPFAPGDRVPHTTTVASHSKARLREAVRAKCPQAPGVYGMLDATGQLIYVGKSKSLRKRLLSYFRKAASREKAGAIVRETSQIVWERRPSEFAALLRELYLIRTWRPRWNVKDQPKAARPIYICLGRPPARHLFATTDPPARSLSWGPFQSRGRVNVAIEALNQHYGLRDCRGSTPFFFSEQAELFPSPKRPGCLRYEIGTCLGPCVGGCSSGTYARHLRKARSFLDGRDDAPLRALEQRMNAAADQKRYESAARWRDRIDALEWLSQRLDYLNQARRRFNFVYPVRSTSGRTLWYVIHRGCVAAALHAPTPAHQRDSDLRLLQEWQRTGRLDGFPLIERHPTINLVSHWFRTRDGQLQRTLTVEQALAQYCDQKAVA